MISYNYDYVVIDFEWIHRRNWSVCKRSFSYERQRDIHSLMSFNLRSLNKILRETRALDPILLWDKRPYLKSEIITEYKINRKIYQKEDLEGLDSESDEYKKISHELYCSDILRSSKKIMLEEWRDFIRMIIISGYEADDLAFYVRDMISSKESTSTILFYTKDEDWKYLANETHSVILPRKKDDLFYNKSQGDVLYKIIEELYKRGHNNVKLSKTSGDKKDISDIIEQYKKGELTSKEEKRISAMNPYTYRTEEVLNHIEKIIFKFKYDILSLGPVQSKFSNYQFKELRNRYHDALPSNNLIR